MAEAYALYGREFSLDMNRFFKPVCCAMLSAFYYTAAAQRLPAPADSIQGRMLDSIIVSSMKLNASSFLPSVDGMHIYAGKKTNLVVMGTAPANLAQNSARTAFAQIPGLTIWEMDGAGTQLNIGSRGTDTHRSIEMNMRQNGYNVNSDMFGYPEAHYTPPLQAVQRIELVRGSAALQFGSQFGGMMNMVLKEGDSTRPFSLQSEQTAGSNGLFNSFNSVGGKKGRISYYAYYNQRSGNGWRSNAAYQYHAYHLNVRYDFNAKGSIALQFSRMDYRQQIAGGLTDAQFKANPRQSLRARNFFSPDINLPALLFNYRFTPQTRLQVISHYLFGQRNSVQFLNTPDIADTVNTALRTFNPRQVDRDYYNGFTTEARLLHDYRMGKVAGTLSAGLRYFTQLTKRRQKGTGTAGSDFDLGLTKPYGIDLRFNTDNYAAFAENLFKLSDRLSVTPGARFEGIQTSLQGVISNASVPVQYRSSRYFPLFGTGLQYTVSRSAELYGNVSQAYRPYLYANVTPADRIDLVDPDLKDSKGYDADLGLRGNIKDILRFDVNGYYLFYGNRIGQLTLHNQTGASYLYTTNIGDAAIRGVEAYLSVSFLKMFTAGSAQTAWYQFRLFNSFSYTHARYLDVMINKSGTNTSIKGNQVEGVPTVINRSGLVWQHRALSATLGFTSIGKSFSDANNTVFNPTGATGVVPAYHLWDVNARWRFLSYYSISGGINNLFNTRYFTRRINMYPGPGILPGDGRTFYLSIGAGL